MQRTYHFLPVLADGVVERSVSEAVDDVDVGGEIVDEQLGRFEVTVGRSKVERRAAVVVARVSVQTLERYQT